MTEIYNKEKLTAQLAECCKLQSEAGAMFNELIYTPEMWGLKQKLKDVTGRIKLLEVLHKEAPPTGELNANVQAKIALESKVIALVHRRMKKYHKKHVEQDRQTVTSNNATARQVVSEVETVWKPNIKSAVKAKNWLAAAQTVLAMPYRHQQYAGMIFDRKITEPAIIKACEGLDKYIVEVCSAIPERFVQKAAALFYQEKINVERARAHKVLKALRNKFAADENFEVGNLPEEHLFLQKEQKALEAHVREINAIDFEYLGFIQLPNRQKDRGGR